MVTTSARHAYRSPSSIDEAGDPAAAPHRGAQPYRSATRCSARPRARPQPTAEYLRLSACARGDQTAGPAASIEKLELDSRRVDRATHQAAERVDLANEMAFRRSAHGRIARHVRDGLARQRAQTNAAPEPRGGVRGFHARMPAPMTMTSKLHHFPMQNLSKMCCSSPRCVRVPTISSKRARAACRSARHELFRCIARFDHCLRGRRAGLVPARAA